MKERSEGSGARGRRLITAIRARPGGAVGTEREISGVDDKFVTGA